MKVAVLMSTYNGAAFLQQQIESILSQQGDFSLDLWVRDDGSQDDTINLLKEYESSHKLQWYTGKNLKPAHSFWDLLLHCPGYDYYAFADQDDVWEENKLQAAIKSISHADGPALACANAQLVGAKLEDLGRNVYLTPPALDFETLSIAGGILGCTMVLNHPLAQLLQSRDMPNNMVMHDFYIALICALAGGELYFDMTPHMKYRQHGSNVVGASRSKLSALKDRLNTITKRAKVTVSQQAQNILMQYPELGTDLQQQWLRKLACPSFFNRLSVACSTKTHYVNQNKAITLRLSILLGNR